MDIGAALREARQRRNRTLRQVSAATKISVEILEKIERNKFDSLPGGLFRRGYLRAFALDVGVDPEAVVEAYRAEYQPPPEVPEKATRSSMSPDQLRLLASAATVVVLVAGLAIGALWTGTADEDADESASVPVLPTTGEVQVVDTTAHTPQRASVEGFTLRFDASFDEPCWVSAIVDGVPVTYGTLGPDTPLVVEANSEIVLRVGNAGAVRYSINGYPGRPLGRPGQVVNLRIDPESYKDLVQVPVRTEA